MRDFDHTKVKSGDRFRVIERLDDHLDAVVGAQVIVYGEMGKDGFCATDGQWYFWSQVEPIEPALITRPIEGMSEWLANTKKGEAVKCRAKEVAEGPWLSDPIWIIGCNKFFGFYSYIDTEGFLYHVAEPWTEPEQDMRTEQEIRAELSAATELVRTLQVELAQLVESDARYGRDL